MLLRLFSLYIGSAFLFSDLKKKKKPPKKPFDSFSELQRGPIQIANIPNIQITHMTL